jgi:hypothetical protein
MDKKPLIGVSIIAVVLLVLGSLTNVVGYQSVKSSTVNDSPLFQTRTQRATNQQQNILTSQYLGKGINAIQFPLRDNRIEQIQKAIEIIEKMDEKAMFAFIAMNIARMNIGNQRKDISILEISTALNQLKSNRDILTNYIDDIKNNNAPKPFTLAGPGCQWRPGGWLIEIVLFVLVLLFYNIAQFFTLAFCTPPFTYNCLLHK